MFLFGFVLIYIPARLFSVVARPETYGGVQLTGILVCAAGGTLALCCVFSFAILGRGTPAPFAAPRRLVTNGPYKLVRNPMYIGVGLFFTGTALFYESTLFFAYVALFSVASHVFVVFYEEPTLQRTFGSEYSAYRSRARRWLPWLPAHKPGPSS